ncbi:Fic family protein [Dyadobacter arcticus]|uniref:Fic family protein n=1 Tax=Dyadobacter arcticus TaxID=1078754 RepID=A0ABX0UQ70_9BACT|nr:Fic family protein [Dyadobacter arcticus]NIJ53820.1 Fic family protein [Dyadobacter arcticus]
MPYAFNPDRNVPWNNLPDLPISEDLFRTVDVFEQLANAKASLGRLQGRSIAIPNQGMLINTISLQEAKASSAIENIFTTDDELYKAFSEYQADRSVGPPKEILMYREALWFGYEYLKKRKHFDHHYFNRIYQQVNQTNDSIRPPFIQTYIRQGGTGPNSGKAIYTPPRGTGILEAKLENLANYLNDDQTFNVDPVIKMAIAHFQFEAIHPFRDGNGRTGRIMNIHYLTHKGLLDYPILFLSRFIMDNKEDYYSGLMGVSQRGDWKTWLLFMLKAVEVTADLTYNKINDILSAKEAILHAIVSDTDIVRPDSIVNVIFTQPFTRVKYFTDQRMYAENTVKKYLNRLVEMGILERRSMQGNHYYLNLELYRILAE